MEIFAPSWAKLVGFGVVMIAYGVYWAYRSFMRPLSAAEARDHLVGVFRDKCRGGKGVRNASVRISALDPRLGGPRVAPFSVRFDGEDVSVVGGAGETHFLSASVGKLVTAAVVASLSSDDALPDFSFDSDAREILKDGLRRGTHEHLSKVVESLGSLYEGGDFGGGSPVTLRSLLSHRTGLPDYFTRGNSEMPSVSDLMLQMPSVRWTPQGAIVHACTHFGPLKTGEFVYADTNYDIVGLCCEIATGRAFHELARERVLSPAGMDATWYHAREERPGLKIDECLFGESSVTLLPSASVDWAGGGLATTATDLTRLGVYLHDAGLEKSLFFGPSDKKKKGAKKGAKKAGEMGNNDKNAVGEGKDSDSGFTRDAMNAGIDYGAGVWRIRPVGLSRTLGGLPDLFGASGATSSFMYTCPEYNAVIAGTFNQTSMVHGSVEFLVRCLLAMRRAPPNDEGVGARKEE